jgi:hypothetical protein
MLFPKRERHVIVVMSPQHYVMLILVGLSRGAPAQAGISISKPGHEPP